MPRTQAKHHRLAEAFAQAFTGNPKFTSDTLSKWAHENGCPKEDLETRGEHAARVVRYLRQAGPQPKLATAAFRIVNRGWHQWEKQEVNAETVIRLHRETCEKMVHAAGNGQKANARLCNVLVQRELMPNEEWIVAFSPNAYIMLNGTLTTIQDNLQKLFASVQLTALGHTQNRLPANGGGGSEEDNAEANG